VVDKKNRTQINAEKDIDRYKVDIHYTAEQQSFIANGRQIWAYGACAKPRGITEAALIPGARIVSAANAVEYLPSGASSLSF
jgi:hypothetical protein